MNTEYAVNGPLLTIDIGSISTRCMLFDPAGDRYHLVGTGNSITTLGLYGQDVRFGLRLALEELQAVTGRILLDGQKRLIQPVAHDGAGVYQCVATVSAGPPLKLYLVGLLKDISFASVERLAHSTYTGQIKSTFLNDSSEPAAQIDEILAYRPDLILIAGGTDKGASQAVLRFLEPVWMAVRQLPDAYQPEILFVGNTALQPSIRALFDHSSRLHLAANIRPDLEQETLVEARAILAQITVKIRSRQIPGLADVIQWTAGNLLPTSWSFCRVIQYLSRTSRSQKGVIGIDLGYSTATLIAANSEQLSFGMYPVHALPGSATLFPELADGQKLQKWLTTVEPSEEKIQEYFFNHVLYPTSLPVTKSEREIINELNRYFIGAVVDLQRGDFPAKMNNPEEGEFFWGEPVLASGYSLTNSASLSQSCLTLLDCLQPAGITTIILDQNQIAACLGALAGVNPLATTQLLDSDLFMHLATVISPVGRAPAGTPILRVKMTTDDGSECLMDVRQGELEVIPLAPGRSAQLQLQPFHRFDIGMGGAGRGGGVRITGSALGIVIDGRGRPLNLPDDLEQRGGLYRKWLWMLGD